MPVIGKRCKKITIALKKYCKVGLITGNVKHNIFSVAAFQDSLTIVSAEDLGFGLNIGC